MPFLPRLAALWRNLIHGKRVERDLDDELRSTLEMLVDAKLRQGLSQGDARRAAAIELGGLDGRPRTGPAKPRPAPASRRCCRISATAPGRCGAARSSR